MAWHGTFIAPGISVPNSAYPVSAVNGIVTIWIDTGVFTATFGGQNPHESRILAQAIVSSVSYTGSGVNQIRVVCNPTVVLQSNLVPVGGFAGPVANAFRILLRCDLRLFAPDDSVTAVRIDGISWSLSGVGSWPT